MQDIYLIRHTTPAVAKGVCYGQTDLGITESFEEETAIIRECLPARIGTVYSSPLRRCTLLAEALFPGQPIHLRHQLMEIDCGHWEMHTWDELPKEDIDPWMADFVNIRIPGGESYLDLHARVTHCFEEIVAAAGSSATSNPAIGSTTASNATTSSPTAIVAHGGVIRSILSGLTKTPLIDSFKIFSLHYGCVIRIHPTPEGLAHTMVSNRAPAEKEQHKPSSFYNKRNL